MYVNSDSWSRLPNAKYIKQLLDSVLLSPCTWMGGTELPRVAWTVAQNAAFALTWEPTRNAAWNTAWCTASTAVWNGTGSAADVANAYAQLEPKLRQLQAEIDAHMV